jgi:hypothetical protein
VADRFTPGDEYRVLPGARSSQPSIWHAPSVGDVVRVEEPGLDDDGDVYVRSTTDLDEGGRWVLPEYLAPVDAGPELEVGKRYRVLPGATSSRRVLVAPAPGEIVTVADLHYSGNTDVYVWTSTGAGRYVRPEYLVPEHAAQTAPERAEETRRFGQIDPESADPVVAAKTPARVRLVDSPEGRAALDRAVAEALASWPAEDGEKTEEPREHVLSADCWCVPEVETVPGVVAEIEAPLLDLRRVAALGTARSIVAPVGVFGGFVTLTADQADAVLAVADWLLDDVDDEDEAPAPVFGPGQAVPFPITLHRP